MQPPTPQVPADFNLLMRALTDRLEQSRRMLNPRDVARVLAPDQLTQYTPRQKLRGLDRCSDALRRVRHTLFVRTVLQDHMLDRERLKADCDEILAVLAAENDEAKSEPLPRVDMRKISPDEFFRTYAHTPQPVVIENVCPDVGRFTVDALIRAYGDTEVPLLRIGSGEAVRGPLSELAKGETYLANSDRLFVDHPDLLDDLKIEPFKQFTRLRYLSSQFFISAAGAGSPAHFGKIANTFYQLQGSKRWMLVDPAFLYFLYPVPFPADCSSALHWMDESDHARAPLFKYCPRYEVTLNPGDVLWNPFYWFHSVKNLTPESVAVAVRWTGVPGREFQSPLPFYDLATAICPRSIDIDMFVAWREIQERLHQKREAWYEQVSHGRRYIAFDYEDFARAWSIEPADVGGGFLRHE